MYSAGKLNARSQKSLYIRIAQHGRGPLTLQDKPNFMHSGLTVLTYLGAGQERGSSPRGELGQGLTVPGGWRGVLGHGDGSCGAGPLSLSQRSRHAQKEASSSLGNLLFSPIIFNGLWKKECCGLYGHFWGGGVRVRRTLELAAGTGKDLTQKCW